MPDGSFPVRMVAGVPVVTAPAEIDITNATGMRAALLDAALRGTARLTTVSRAFRAQPRGCEGMPRTPRRWRSLPSLPPSLPRGPAADTLQRALAFIDDRAFDDITVADIAGASFVTVRALQMSFRRHLGTTPLGYLRRVRLECAHRDLLDADPGHDTVTEIAARWKFSLASRFSAYYRTLYGVLPGYTLHHGQAAVHEQAG